VRTGQGPDRCVRVVSMSGVCVYAARAERRVRLSLANGMAFGSASHGLAVHALALGKPRSRWRLMMAIGLGDGRSVVLWRRGSYRQGTRDRVSKLSRGKAHQR
jgi:hypothetical protein